MVFFSFGWTPLQGLYPAEVLAYENRAKGLFILTLVLMMNGTNFHLGLALQGWCTSAASLINTFGMPIALRDIGYISTSYPSIFVIFVIFLANTLDYFIFFAWDVVGVVVIYLFIVETKQVSRTTLLQVKKLIAESSRLRRSIQSLRVDIRKPDHSSWPKTQETELLSRSKGLMSLRPVFRADEICMGMS
jgi:hypothetical protein